MIFNVNFFDIFFWLRHAWMNSSSLISPSLFVSIFLKSFSNFDSSPRNSSNDKYPSKSLSRLRKKSSTSSLKAKHLKSKLPSGLSHYYSRVVWINLTLRWARPRHWVFCATPPGSVFHPCLYLPGQSISGSGITPIIK